MLCFQLVGVRKTVSSLRIIQGSKKIEVEGAKSSLLVVKNYKFKLHTAVAKVMARYFCYSEGTLFVELRAISADFKEVTTKFGQTAI